MRIYWQLLRYVSQIKKEVCLKTLMGIGVTFTYILQAISMSYVIQGVWQRYLPVRLLPGFLLVLGMIMLRSLLSRYAEGYNKVLGARIKGKMRLAILDKVSELGPAYMNEARSGKVTSIIIDGMESLEPFYVNFIPQILVVLVSGSAIFIYLCRLDAFSSILLVLSMVLCVVVPLISVPFISRNVTDYWTEYSLITAEYIDTIQGITTLKTLNAEKQQGNMLLRHAEEFYRKSIRNTGISLVNSGIMVVLAAIISNVSVVSAAIRYSQGKVSSAAVTAFLFLAVECARPMMDLNRHWHSSFLGLSIARDLFTLLEMQPRVQDGPAEVYHEAKEPLDLTLQEVSFSYTEEKEVLDRVNMTVPFGSTVALVGPSGSGKSTIMNLLLRFYDPDNGAIRLADRDLREYPLSCLHQNMAVVFQDTYLFYGTIEENIRMSNPKADDEAVMEAAKRANAHDFIMKLPLGYQTIVGEHGVTLSGGERQRLSLARAFLKNAPVLLLDEATSSVDSESEKLFQDSVSQMYGSCTVLMIAHRLSTVRQADRIFVLEQGKIVEAGTHDELMRTEGTYRRLLRSQEEIANEL